MQENHFTDNLAQEISKDSSLSKEAKTVVMKNLARLKAQKVNILIVGATGCGKSSTINAMFNTNKAKVGQGSTPETMDIAKYEMDNIVVYDSPGLGDGKEADIRHSKNIIAKLLEKNNDKDGDLLIDLVLVILDGSSRDLGTSFQLIENIIIPNLGSDSSRLLVTINQADMAMKGRNWNHDKNEPEPVLVDFLNDKCLSTKKRIKEATGVDVDPIYYTAGYKDGEDSQKPYNLSKLFLHILRHTKMEKRAVFIQDMNKDKDMWKKDDKLEDYENEIKKTLFESTVSGLKEGAETGGNIGENIGKVFGMGTVGRVVGTTIGAVAGAIGGFFGGLFS